MSVRCRFNDVAAGRVEITRRTRRPVAGSARTTMVVRSADSGTGVLKGFAARMGEAASMANASKEQIYTLLFNSTTVRRRWPAEHCRSFA